MLDTKGQDLNTVDETETADEDSDFEVLNLFSIQSIFCG